jgi:WD40 repeat protein
VAVLCCAVLCGGAGQIRLWDVSSRRCVSYLMGIERDVQSLSFSVDRRYLAALGKDHTGRPLIVVWRLTHLLPTLHSQSGAAHSQSQSSGAVGSGNANGRCPVAARQVSEHSIHKLVFAPYESDPHTLVSCGVESVRSALRCAALRCASASLGSSLPLCCVVRLAFGASKTSTCRAVRHAQSACTALRCEH